MSELQTGDEEKNFRNNPILNNVRRRLHRLNQNWIAVITGSVGSGKSWTGIKICRYIDNDFTIDRVVFSAKELLDLVRSGELKRGSAILLDEAGIAMGSREFQSKENKQLSALFQTFRSLNYALVITVPNMAFIDRQARMVLHAIIETQSIDRKRGICRVKYKNVKLHWKTQEPRGYYPWVQRDDGFAMRAPFMSVHKPPKELTDPYESKKKIFLKELVDELAAKLEPDTLKDKAPIKPPNRVCLKCGNSWFYRGVSTRATCSSCKSCRTRIINTSE